MHSDAAETRTERLRAQALSSHHPSSNFSSSVHWLSDPGQMTSQCLSFLGCSVLPWTELLREMPSPWEV